MPTYHARSITVRLGSMPLAETTTSDVVLRKGEVAKRQGEAAERKLLHSFLLDEQRVLFPGDYDGYELNWLGNAPFMQVQADSGFAQPSASNGGPHRSSASDDSRPQALTLHVKLSDKTFNSGFSGKTHLKIDVLFNGQLSACSLIHTNDIRSGAKSLHQVFAGYRVDFLAERPWVILPPYITADGGTRRFYKTVTPSERWEQISTILLKEAEERGTSTDGKLPPSAELLQALAKMQMPESVKEMQKPGGRKFGVVDVVITAGTGSKLTNGANYLKSPQRLRDPHYTLRAEPTPENEAATAESYQDGEAADILSQAEAPTLVDADADVEGDSNALQERPRKRQALSSAMIHSQPMPHDPDFQSPFFGAQIPHLPPPMRSTSHNDLAPVAGRVSPRCPSPEYRSDGHKQPLPSNDRHHTYETPCEMSSGPDWSSDALRVFQEYHSPSPNLQTSAPHAFPTYSNPMGMPFPTPIAGHGAFGDLPSITSTPGSSPMMQTFGNYSPLLARLSIPSGTASPTHATTPVHSTPYVAPTALMNPTPTNWRGPLNAFTTPYYCHSYPSQQAPFGLYSPGVVPHMPPNGLPYLLPQTPPSYENSGSAQYATPVTPSSAVYQSSRPLPPTAMFTVTSKPRRRVSPTKDPGLIDPNAFRPSVLVTRLVITGLNGTPVLDHRWKIAQRIVVNLKVSRDLVAEDHEKTSSSEFDEPTARSRVRKQSASRNSTYREGSRANPANKRLQHPIVEQSVHEQRRDSVQDGQGNQAINGVLPYLRKHHGPIREDLPSKAEIDIPESIAPFVSAPMPTSTAPTLMHTRVSTLTSVSSVQPSMPQRRTYSRNALPGIQGPKAATFLLDDPEEVLREAARMRRSRSPTKPAATQSVPPIVQPIQVGSSIDRVGAGNSSPLSSVPSSPVPEGALQEAETAGTLVDQIPQLDGSPERTIPTTSPCKLQTPSPAKPSLPKQKSQRPDPVTLQASVSLESKKRKASTRSYTKTPRSPGRLKTVSNPPLNNDCVIAFAESEDKEVKRGVLRQVKGERQGVFKEEYVVLAVRFFIPGD